MKDLINIEAEHHSLTPAERLEMFCEACAMAFTTNARLSDVQDRFESGLVARHAAFEEIERLSELGKEAQSAEQELIARAKVLHGDGTLDRCIDILQAETAGQL